MTPQEFISKWRSVDLKERSASQSHFNDLCRLLGVDDPITADPKGEWFAFEKGASKTSGGEGWADVWRKKCFAWEYKGKKKDLDKAFAQLQQYAIALENPPLLIVSDMERIRIHTNWTNTVQKVHDFALDDLTDGANRDLLHAAFTDPEKLRPTKTRQRLTEDAAQKFASLALRLRARGHDAETVAHFVNRLVFCMFAEDVGLLPNKMFQKMLELCQSDPSEFQPFAKDLFAAMKSGGRVGFEKVDWFNGGLFNTDDALALEKDDLADLLAAARLDWSEVDPSILGTLFERGLDPDKRSQLGAHYTDRDKIMQIVGPVVVDPLLAEWQEARGQIEVLLDKAPKQTKDKLLRGRDLAARTKALKQAEALHQGFLDRLNAFKVLDPACGSGNFLYLSLLSLKDLEHRSNLEAEALGLPRGFPRVGPESVLGIELNPYAAELARISVWIGEIQWMRRNGFDAARNPILRPLDTIECRDAVLNTDGSKADWPNADAVVGNPPFLGNKRMIGSLGENYTAALRGAWPEVPGGADLVTYWFAKAWAQMQASKLSRAGLVATNSIRGGASREVLKSIVSGGRIFDAWSDEQWTVDGASVRVSMVCFEIESGETARLDGAHVATVFSDLAAPRGGVDLTRAAKLLENRNTAFQGISKVGPFEIDGSTARDWLLAPFNPNGMPNAPVLRPWITGTDLTSRSRDEWVVDFGLSLPVDEAALFEKPFAHIENVVQPVRQKSRRDAYKLRWWIHGEARPGLRRAIADRSRYVVTPKVSKHRFFAFSHSAVLPSNLTIAVGKDDACAFGVLSSAFHEHWALALGQWVGAGNDPTYTPSTTFETFPFPEGLTPDIPAADYADDARAQAIATAAVRLNELRENWLNPSDLVDRVPEVVPGYPDRLLPKNDKAAKELKKRTLTNLYNARPAWLDNAHKVLDEAVADAYGWGDDWRAGTLTDDEILARLFALNQARAAAEETRREKT